MNGFQRDMFRQWRSRLAGSRLATGMRDLLLPYLLVAAHARLPVALWRGPARPSGRPGTLLVAGKEPWVSYLPERFFAGESQREHLGCVPTCALPRALQRFQSVADLTIVRADRISAGFFFDAQYLAVPEWVGTSLTVPDDLDLLVRANRSVCEDMRAVLRSGFQASVSHTEEDFDSFYNTMYLPYIQRRYGELAIVRNPHRLRRRFHRGGILWVQRDGRRLAGAIFELQRRRLVFLAVGIANGKLALVKEHVTAAVYYHIIAHACRQGCAQVDFGSSRSSLHDGVLRYKRKWGIKLGEWRYSNFDLLVRWNRIDGVVADFLSHTPLIFRDRGSLSAVHALNVARVATAADALHARHCLWIDGLRRLYLLSATGWEPVATAPLNTTLIDARIGPGWHAWDTG